MLGQRLLGYICELYFRFFAGSCLCVVSASRFSSANDAAERLRFSRGVSRVPVMIVKVTCRRTRVRPSVMEWSDLRLRRFFAVVWSAGGAAAFALAVACLPGPSGVPWGSWSQSVRPVGGLGTELESHIR